MSKSKNTKTVETVDNLKNDSTIGRDNNKSVATKNSKVKTMSKTNNEKSLSIVTEENFIKSVVKGGKKKNVKEELENYLRSQFNCLYLTSNVATFQLKVSDVIKQFLEISENKINASSYDLNADIQNIIFTLATEYKNNGEKRIPCIKANSNNVSILMTCDVSKYSYFYEKNIKSIETSEKSAKAREEKKAKEEQEKKAKEENTIYVDDSKKATLCVLELIAKYGDNLDLRAIKDAIKTVDSVKNTEKENTKKSA